MGMVFHMSRYNNGASASNEINVLSGILMNAPVLQSDYQVIGYDGNVGIVSINIGTEYIIIIVYPEIGSGDGVGYVIIKNSTNIVGHTQGNIGWGITKDNQNRYIIKRCGTNISPVSMRISKSFGIGG